jgi:hypothetical protein
MVGCYLGFGRRLKGEVASKEKNPRRWALGFFGEKMVCADYSAAR